MLFRRREPEGLIERLRVWLWPRRSFSRSLRYMGKRILRISATPHAVALGLAIGVFFACTPLLGFHIIFAVIVAWLCRANIASAILGTAFANPLTIPLFFSLNYEVGHFILDLFGQSREIPLSDIVDMFEGASLTHLFQTSFSQISETLYDFWTPVFKPLLLGALIVGGCLSCCVYLGGVWATSRFQRRRRQKIADKIQAKLLKEHSSGGVAS